MVAQRTDEYEVTFAMEVKRTRTLAICARLVLPASLHLDHFGKQGQKVFVALGLFEDLE